MLQSNQLSYGIPRGVEIVIMGCTVALQCNPTWCLLEIDFANAHTNCSRGSIWEELERGTYFHFLIHIFLSLYGDNATPIGTLATARTSLPRVYTGRAMDSYKKNR
jgi:hypothetical protein